MTTLLPDGSKGYGLDVIDEQNERRRTRDDPRRFVVTGVSSGQRCVTVAMHGELDATAALILFGQLAFFFVDDPLLMVADMNAVTLFDSDGLGAVIDARRALRLRNCDLAIREPSAAVRQTLELAGFAGLVER